MPQKKSRLAALLAGLSLLSSTLHTQAAEEAANPIGHFEIVRFEVQGNTLLPAAKVDQLLAPFAGKDRDFGSVQKALEALEGEYRKEGYSVVKVVLPEQELNHGVVQLRVIETKIGKITIEGNKFFDDNNIRKSLPPLQEGKSPNLTDVSDSLRVANDNPAKKTTLQLQTGDDDDHIDAHIKVVDEKPWTVGVSVDNTGDENTGRNHLTVQYQNANVGGADHVLSLQYTTSFADPSNVKVFGAGYHIPLYSLGDSLDFYGSYSDVNSGTISAGLFDLAVSGRGTVLGARYNHTLAKQGNYDSKLIYGLDYKAFQNDISEAGLPLGNDVTVHPFSLTYTGNWSNTTNTANFYLSGVRNIPGGNNGSSSDFAAARVDASSNYSLLRYGASYTHIFSQDWQVRLSLTGQATDNALVEGEQFGAGGATSVRGFEEREIAGDQGRVTNAEIYTPNLCNGKAQCRLLTFYDTGHVSNNDVQLGEISSQWISSYGLGWRLSVAPYLVMLTDFAHVIDGTDLSPAGSNRVHFRVVYTY